jgi:hypothetical protein
MNIIFFVINIYFLFSLGTVVPESRLPPNYMNFTFLWSLFEEAQGLRNDAVLPPPQHELVIYNSSRLLINLEVQRHNIK